MTFLSHPKNLDRHQFGQKAKGSALMLLPNKEDIKHVAAKGHVLGSKKGQLGFILVEEPEEQQPLKQPQNHFFSPNCAILERF